MSRPAKRTVAKPVVKNWIQRLTASLEQSKKVKKLTALDLTTIDGDIINFPDVAEDGVPQEGDIATIGGEPVDDGKLTIVDNEEEYEIEFIDGKVAPTASNETELELLQEENEALQEELEVVTGKLTALQGTMAEYLQTLKSEDHGKTRLQAFKKATPEKGTLAQRLKALQEKKAKR